MKRGARWGLAVAGVGLLVLLYGPALLAHARHAADPLWFNDDARIYTWPLLRFSDPALFPGDPIADYVLALLPAGYKALHRAVSHWLDALVLAAILPYANLAVVMGATAFAAGRIGGAAAAWGALALACSAEVLLERMAGGLPRSFAFPLLALAALALVVGRPALLAGVTLLGAALYPVVAVLAGLALALWMLLPASDRAGAAHASAGRRAGGVALTALATLLVLAPLQLEARRYGPRIGPADVRAFPEAGPGGRYPASSVPPYPGLAADLAEAFATSVAGRSRPWAPALRDAFEAGRGWAVPALAATLCALLGLAALREAALRRLLLLLLAAALGHAAAHLAAPQLFLPARYTAYAVPVVVLAGLPSALTVLLRRWPRARGAGVVGGCVALLLAFGGRGSESVGFTVRRERLSAPLEFAASLRPEVRLAAWPRGLADDLPYLARRSVLLSAETHQAFHRGYVLASRRRMEAFLEAYFASERGPLERLREDFGVTHLVVDRRHFPEPPAYFEPFAERVRSAARRLGGSSPQWAREPQARVFDQGPWLVLDLSRLGPASPEGAQRAAGERSPTGKLGGRAASRRRAEFTEPERSSTGTAASPEGAQRAAGERSPTRRTPARSTP